MATKYVPPHARHAPVAAPASTLDWLRGQQTASGPVGRVAGPEQAPQVRGYMYESEEERGEMEADMVLFDSAMVMFRRGQGPPPTPLRAARYNSSAEVRAYEAWWGRTGAALARKWLAAAAPAPKKVEPVAAAKKVVAATAKEEAGPRRIVTEVSASSGW
jgi:hypothetical protein